MLLVQSQYQRRIPVLGILLKSSEISYSFEIVKILSAEQNFSSDTERLETQPYWAAPLSFLAW